jgi:hypothetical protein
MRPIYGPHRPFLDVAYRAGTQTLHIQKWVSRQELSPSFDEWDVARFWMWSFNEWDVARFWMWSFNEWDVARV